MTTSNAFVRIGHTTTMSLETFASGIIRFGHRAIDSSEVQIRGALHSPGHDRSLDIDFPFISMEAENAYSYARHIDTSQYSATLALAIGTTRRLAMKRKLPVYLDIHDANGQGDDIVISVVTSSVQYPSSDISSIDLYRDNYEALWSVTLGAVARDSVNGNPGIVVLASQTVELNL